MDTVEAPPKPHKVPPWLVPTFGYGISGASLLWVFWRFPWAQLSDHLRTLEWNWVAIAILFEVAVYFVDAWRWKVLLGPVGAPSFGLCLQGVFIGVLANDILPAKAGELIRCFLLSYESKVSVSLAITSDVILRIMDGVWIVLLYLAVTLQVGTHTDVRDGMWFFGTAAVAIAGLALFVLFRRQHAHHFVRNTSWAARFVHLLDEIHRLGNWPELKRAMAIGSLYWITQMLAIWALTKADRFDLGLSAAGFLLVVKAVATVLPNAPANVGAYQAAVVYASRFLFVEHPQAQAFAEIMFLFLTLPIAVGGAIAVLFADMDLFTLHRHAKENGDTGRLR